MSALGDIFDGLFGWLLPKKPRTKPPTLDDFSLPTAADGKAYGVGYGTFWVTGPNVTWYGDLVVRTQTKDGVKMRRYYMGLHIEWSEGPWDAFLILKAEGTEGKLIWEGEVTESGQITLDAGKIFGGRDKGGGVSGLLDVMFGESTQMPNDYLVGLLGPLPAFRGRMATVLRQGLVGANNTSVIPWCARGRRIYKGWYQDTCWYPETAAIVTIVSTDPESSVPGVFTVEVGATYHNGLVVYGVVGAEYVATAQEIGENAIAARNSATGSSYVCTGTLYAYAGGPYIVAWDASRGPDTGIAACQVVPTCGVGQTVEIVQNDPNSNLTQIDNPTVLCHIDATSEYDYDMNPAHIVYDLLTNPKRGLPVPISQIDDDNFRDAADIAYNELFGLSFPPEDSSDRGDMIDRVLEHWDAVLRISPAGKFQIVPIRGNYDPDDLIEWTPANIVKIEDFQSVGYGELTARVTVAYTHPVTGKKATTAAVDNPATIRAQLGSTRPALIEYPGIRQHTLAARVRDRELRKRSQPLKAFTVYLDRSDTSVERGDVRKVTWPDLGLDGVIVRVTAVNRGSLTARTMKVSVVEDVFGLPDSVYTTPTDSLWTDPSGPPIAVTIQDAMELPYHWLREALGDAETASLPDASGYGVAFGKQPQGLADGYDLWGRIDPASYAEIILDREFYGTALLNGSLARDSTSLVIDGSNIDTELVEPGWLLLLGTGRDAEWMRVTGGNLTTGITVDRAILDTTPGEHADNTRLWVVPFELITPDDTRYSDGDEIDYKLLTRTSSGVLAIADATAVSVTMDSRQVRPYPPGGVTVNSEAFPTLLSGALTVDWMHRDRVTQYPTIYTQDDATIGPEAGTTYNAYAYDDSDDTLLDSDTGISGTTWAPSIATSCTLRIEIESERDSFVSWQRQVRIFEYIAESILLTEAGDDLLTEASEFLTTET